LQKTDVLEASIQAATKLLHLQLYRFTVVHNLHQEEYVSE